MRSRDGASRSSLTSRFATSLMDILDRVEYRRVDLADRFDPVYRLRYDAYRREDWVPENAEGIATDVYDQSPNARCYGVYIDGNLVSSVRFHHATPETRISPCMRMYPELLNGYLDAGQSYIDPSRFTSDRDTALAYPALPFLTLRVVAMACEHFDATFCLSAVREEHVAFYRRVFGSREIAGDGHYPGLNFPVKLYAAEVREIRNRVADRFPFFMSTPEERAMMFGDTPEAHYLGLIRPTARAAAMAEDRFFPVTEAAE